MNIQGYTYVTHKLINRPWGPECRFTVRKGDGTLIDDVVPILKMDLPELELQALIFDWLVRIDVPPPPPQETPDEKIMKLEAQVTTLTAEKATLLTEKTALLKGVK